LTSGLTVSSFLISGVELSSIRPVRVRTVINYLFKGDIL
jgi:hypothetical protein